MSDESPVPGGVEHARDFFVNKPLPFKAIFESSRPPLCSALLEYLIKSVIAACVTVAADIVGRISWALMILT